MSSTSDLRSDDFLKIADQFKLGALVTESSHPVTANLSDVAKQDTAKALDLLFQVDEDVVRTYEALATSGRLHAIAQSVFESLRNGARLFFTGCGSTGRLSIQLDSIWRHFWREQASSGDGSPDLAKDMEERTFSVMAGGDFALIKAVEGFEDYTAFGRRQVRDVGISGKDVLFAITEGGETSFVIGTAWEAVDAGAKTYFVYNNPDDILCEHVQRSREVIQDSRIQKVNLTTGPMSITGSTRMQATSIQLCVMLTLLEMVIRSVLNKAGKPPEHVPAEFVTGLNQIHASLRSPDTLKPLADLVEMEESIYRLGHRINYFANRFGIDILTDTTERSPTYCTPPFRKFDDTSATESWAYLFVPHQTAEQAWRHILKRSPRCVSWPESDVPALVGPEKAERTIETIRRIGEPELMRFRIGLDGLAIRQPRAGDGAVVVLGPAEAGELTRQEGFAYKQLDSASQEGARGAAIFLGTRAACGEVRAAVQSVSAPCSAVLIEVPETGLLLDGVTRVGLKMMMNALSTATMVRLGRVMGNYMIWVVASNLKLIDRATRYIQRLTGLEYKQANRLLFEVVEFVEPRMKADQVYPPVVGVAVIRARHNVDNLTAERMLKESQ